MFDNLRSKLTKYYVKKIFMENHDKNVPQQLVQDAFLILVNNLRQQLYARNSFKNKIF